MVRDQFIVESAIKVVDQRDFSRKIAFLQKSSFNFFNIYNLYNVDPEHSYKNFPNEFLWDCFSAQFICAFLKNLYSLREGIEQKAMKKSVIAQKTAAHT